MMGGGEEIEQEVKEPQLSKGGIRGNREVKKRGMKERDTEDVEASLCT